jgi:predicted esterase/catechol 2,3-dioxygenase-like lactoylglutathione lyase family enzyme
MPAITGLHHISAIAGDPQRNLDFYVGILGLRLVKRTVNFDDPQTYHFYFGDELGTPGTLMTFFPWPGARSGRQGTGQVAVSSFAIAPNSVGFWIERLLRHGVQYDGPLRRGSGPSAEHVIPLRDHDGTMLELVASPGAAARAAWSGDPGLPAEHSIRGLHGVTLWVEQGEATELVLTGVLGLELLHDADGSRRFAVDDGSSSGVVYVRAVGGFPRGTGGTGTVHHVAFAAADADQQLAMRERAVAAGLDPTPVIDRSYFRSVYFREPGGVLFEIATVGPGFAIDEPADALGARLMLPPQYEAQRAQIEAVLPPVHLPVSPTGEAFIVNTPGPDDVNADTLDFIHRYIPPANRSGAAASTTLLLLHGTGGDEEDLIPLGRTLLPGAGLLSPRGKVREGGAPRFFRRIAEGVFDLEDLALRTEELGRFVQGAARTYRLDAGRMVAVGFSNGANIAASLMLRHPGALRAGVLLSPMVPFEPDVMPDLAGTDVFIGAGRSDPIAPAEQAQRLADLLRNAGADVTLHWHPGGHQVTRDLMDAAREWLITRS